MKDNEKNEKVIQFIQELLNKSSKFVIVAFSLDEEGPAFVGTKNLCKNCIRENLFKVVENSFKDDPDFMEDCHAEEGSIKSPYISIIKKQ